ncbi:hypothetical protein GCM10010365_11310 [Streptomyces poonensis]|uniref:HTH merR-type domain-containing protein n=1 Tax=Streptomyces poonensis TaxID=68255 RepID=A0A918UDZ6_9ACTN|nr:hypothetical protein GCM10010365_11310 [Streptomyces poonensis]GLJ87428.1 hypothetical protein GCM10017589_00280 [Streptomyces poonensis]
MTLPLGQSAPFLPPGGSRPATEGRPEDVLVDDVSNAHDMAPAHQDGLLTIGAFAARVRLSPKALRLYDRLGLLAPAYVDEVSGYRYYRAAQAERARLVAQLRLLDMPLARIAEVVGLDGAAAEERLAAYWAEAEARFAAQRTLAAYLRGRLSGKGPGMFGTFVVETVEVPEQVLLTQSRHTLADELPTWIGASLERLEEGAAHCGGVTGASFVVYHSDVSMESDGPAESCVPVADEAAARAWAAGQGRSWRTAVRVEPARGSRTRGSAKRRWRTRRSWGRTRRSRSGSPSGA